MRRRGSLIAKRIIDDQIKYERDKERALRIKALREAFEKRKRGESNGERTELNTEQQKNTE